MKQPKLYSLSEEALNEMKNCLQSVDQEDDIELILILKKDGSLDVARGPQSHVVHIDKVNGKTAVYDPVPKRKKQKEILKEAKKTTSKKARKTVKRLTENKVVKASTPIAWTAFENSGCVCIGGRCYYC